MGSDRRILAIDVGERRIGLAVTDPMAIFASGLPTAPADEQLIPHLLRLIAEYGITDILVGLPLTLKGEVGESARRVHAFVESLRPHISLPIILWDERFTSVQAEQTIRDLGVNRKSRRRKEKIDELSAVHLLQSYLGSLPAPARS